MKKIINGKRYDTESATRLASYWNGLSSSDFGFIEETLYRKKTGEFFLHGEGGARTQYSRRVGQNLWSGGELLMPLTIEDAQTWAEEHLDGDEYEKIFGEVEEDGSRKVIAVSLAVSTIEKLRAEATRTGRTMSGIVEDLILKEC